MEDGWFHRRSWKCLDENSTPFQWQETKDMIKTGGIADHRLLTSGVFAWPEAIGETSHRASDVAGIKYL